METLALRGSCSRFNSVSFSQISTRVSATVCKHGKCFLILNYKTRSNNNIVSKETGVRFVRRDWPIMLLKGPYHELRGYSVLTHLALKIRSSVKKPLLSLFSSHRKNWFAARCEYLHLIKKNSQRANRHC